MVGTVRIESGGPKLTRWNEGSDNLSSRDAGPPADEVADGASWLSGAGHVERFGRHSALSLLTRNTP